MELWAHNEIRSEVQFLLRRIDEQSEYILDIESSLRPQDHKKELIRASEFLKDQYRSQLGEYLTKGFIAFI